MTPNMNGALLVLLVGLANVHAGQFWGAVCAMVALGIGYIGTILPRPWDSGDDMATIQQILLAACVIATVLSFCLWAMGVR